MMLPISAHHVRAAMEERASSALAGAPVRHPGETRGRATTTPRVRRHLAAALRRAADRFEPVAE
jgi:hypothetical protein